MTTESSHTETPATRERGATLILVRHGQASTEAVTRLSGDYDQLSALGEEQSRRLGPFLGRHYPHVSRVLVGPRRRHAQTYEALRHTLPAGVEWPAAEPCAALDEHHGVQLVTLLAGEIVQRDDPLGEAMRGMMTGGPDRMRDTGRMFRLVLSAWARGDLHHPEVEGWIAFRLRVRSLLSELVGHPEGAIVAVTSAGSVSTLVADVLGVPDERAMDLMWSVRNASITTVRLRGGAVDARPLLHSYNEVPHLEDPSLLTYL